MIALSLKSLLKNVLGDKIIGGFMAFIWRLNENSGLLLRLVNHADDRSTGNKCTFWVFGKSLIKPELKCRKI